MDCSMLGLPVHHHHYSNSHSSSWWCHPTISSSVVPFSSVFNLSQHQGLFRCVSSLHQVAKVLEFQLKHQSFQWIFIGNPKFPEDWLAGSCNPKDSQESSPTPQFKSINSALSFLSEKAVVTHSSTPAWKIPWTEPGRLQSMGLQSQIQLSDFTFTFHLHALEKEMATHFQASVLTWRINPRDRGSLVGCHLWGCTESDTTEAT